MFSKNNEKELTKGHLIIHQGYWWDVALITANSGNVFFKGECGYIQMYGNILTLQYKNAKDKEKLIQEYQLLPENRRH